jgi:hypothetical protein
MLAPSGIWQTELPFSMLVADGIPGTNITGYCDMEKANQLKKGRTLHQLLELGSAAAPTPRACHPAMTSTWTAPPRFTSSA